MTTVASGRFCSASEDDIDPVLALKAAVLFGVFANSRLIPTGQGFSFSLIFAKTLVCVAKKGGKRQFIDVSTG